MPVSESCVAFVASELVTFAETVEINFVTDLVDWEEDEASIYVVFAANTRVSNTREIVMVTTARPVNILFKTLFIIIYFL